MAMKVFVSGEVLTAADLNEYGVNTKVAIATSTENANNNTTPHDDGQLFLTGLTVNAIYMVELLLIYNTSGAGNPDFKFGFTLPAGASFSCTPGGFDPTATAASGAGAGPNRIDVFTSSTKSLATIGSTDVCATPRMLLLMGGTTGTLQLQWSQTTGSVENTARKANSFMLARRVS